LLWNLRAQNATGTICQRRISSNWFLALVTSGEDDAQLGEAVHCYAERDGVEVVSLLRTLGLNLMRTTGFRSIGAGLMAMAPDINRTLGGSGIQALEWGR